MTATTRLKDPIGDLVGAAVATVRPTATLLDAADALASEGLGLLVVVDGGGVRGVLSERDIVAAIAERTDLSVGRVRDHASTDLVQLEEDATVLRAAAQMAIAEVRHVVVTRRDEVIGVVSVRGVLQALLTEHAEAQASSEWAASTDDHTA